MFRSKIIGTGSYVPAKIMTNHDLEEIISTSDHWIAERTGIRERRIASEWEATSDLATIAAERALKHAGLDPMELDLIVVATSTPDMVFPSTACIVQNKIGARRAAAFDISAACSGFIYALAVGDQYIRSGTASSVLVIGAEVMSRIIDWTDRGTCILFGDGAGAVILKSGRVDSGILSTHLHSDGALWDLIHVPGGGSRIPPSIDVLERKLNCIKMKGSETFKVAVRTLADAAWEALKANNLRASDLDLLIPHQANMRIIKAVAEKLEIRMDKVVMNLDRFGNTSAASIPMALDEAAREGRIREGNFILLEGFGGGLTWGSAMVKW
ncbi:MAG: beta-ketoacyl-ACP synthase III [Nitrospirota bacterium]